MNHFFVVVHCAPIAKIPQFFKTFSRCFDDPHCVCGFGGIGKKAPIDLTGNGIGKRSNGRECTDDVDRLDAGSSSLSPFASDTDE
jgi:hypothetical protein